MTSPQSTKREQQLCQLILQDLTFEHSPPSHTPQHNYLPSNTNHQKYHSEHNSKIQLQIELQNGRKVLMFPQPNQQPIKIAQMFCHEHNLDSEMITILAETIKKSINQCEQQHKSKYTLTNMQSQPSAGRDFSQPPSYPLSCKISTEVQSQYLSKKSSISSQISLYERGFRRIEQHKKWVQREKEQKSINQIKQCTHIPSINSLSRSIASQKSYSRLRRNKSMVYMQEDLNSYQQRKKSLKLCHSIVLGQQPQNIPENKKQNVKSINKPKEVSKKNSKNDIFAQLYQNSRMIKNNRARLLSQHENQKSYRPKIDNVSREIVGSVKFNDRLAMYMRQSELKKQKAKKSQAQQKQNWYRPKTGAAPVGRNVDRLPIGDYLYNRQKKVPVIVKPSPIPKVNKNSKHLYELNKKQSFSRIFKHLDAKEEGKISWNHINLQTIDSSIRELLVPLLEEIQIMKIELNQPDFKVALNFLFDSLPLTSKHSILNFQLNTDQPPHPAVIIMNERSRQLISKSSRAEMDVYEYGQLRKAMRHESVQNLRVEQQRRQMQQYTFKPKLQRKASYF